MKAGCSDVTRFCGVTKSVGRNGTSSQIWEAALSNILVTGASGFIGTRLCTLLRERGDRAFAASKEISQNFDSCPFDLADANLIQTAVERADPDVIIHLAALGTVTGTDPKAYYDINALGTERLLDAMDKLGRRTRFILVSTAGVYGNQDASVLSEEMSPLPVHHYGFSKFIAERLTHMAADRHDITIVRPFNVIGKGQRGNFIVPKLVDHFHRRAPVVKLGNIDVTRDYINLDAACSVLIEAIDTPQTFNEVINLCSGRETSLRELIQHLTDITGHTIEIETVPQFTRANEVWHLVGSAVKLDRLLPNRLAPLPVREVLEEIVG